MPTETIPYNIVNYLDSEEMIQEYFWQVLEGGDSEEIVRAIGHIARARGVQDIAARANAGSEALQQTFDTLSTCCAVVLRTRAEPTSPTLRVRCACAIE